jgi:multicomponent Na+:H+ antiporter subunit C
MSINLIVLYWNYIIVIMLMMAGLYIIISNQNFIKKLVGLSIFQSSVFIFYISLGKVSGGTAPILTGVEDTVYSNPLPHVLILTAIVVGVATNALGLALVVRIQEAFKSIEEHKLLALKKEDGLKGIQIEVTKEDSPV